MQHTVSGCILPTSDIMARHVTIKDLFFGYGLQPILKDLSFSLKAGEILTLIGASGSGKTSLLKLISGLLPISQGSIHIGEEIHPIAQNDVAIMMQQDFLLPWRNVLGNVTLAAELAHPRRGRDALNRDALELLAEMEMEHCAALYPDVLSGGMRQRVALARVLLQRRPVLLLDEPFASLDVLTREQLYLTLRHLRTRYQLTILLVTHDFRDALVLSDRILLLANGSIFQQWSIPENDRANPSCLGKWHQELRDAMLEGEKSQPVS